MSHVGGESVVPRASRWGAVLRCVRRRCAPAHSAPPGPPNGCGQGAEMVFVAGARNGNSNCRRSADLNRAERELQLSLNGRNNCRLTLDITKAVSP